MVATCKVVSSSSGSEKNQALTTKRFNQLVLTIFSLL